MTEHDDEIDLWSLLRRIWLFRWAVVGGACVLPLAIAAFVAMRSDSYESTATVLVTNPPVGSSLVKGPLSVEAYQQLAESEPVFNAVRTTLQKQGISASAMAEATLSADGNSTTPWIGLSVISTQAEHARAIANAWAAALMEAEAALADPQAVKIVKSREEAALDLETIENEMRKVQDRHLLSNAKAELKYNESQRRIELSAKRTRAFALEAEIATTMAALEDIKQRIAQLHVELKNTSPSVSSAAAQPNPVFSALTEQLSKERSYYKGLQAKEGILQTQHRAVMAEVDKLHRGLIETQLILAKISTQQRRELDLLTRSATDARARFDRLDQRYVDLVAANGLSGTYLKLKEPATLPPDPRPRTYRYAILALPLGLFASFAGAFLVALVYETKDQK